MVEPAVAPSATEVTLKADKSEITSVVTTTLQWVITKGTVNDKTTYQFNASGSTDYLYCTNTNNGVRVGTNDNKTFNIVVDENNNKADFLFNTATSRYVGVNGGSDWRCYTSINNNIKATITTFYKKVVTEVTGEPITMTFPEDNYDVDINDGFTAPVASITPAAYDGTPVYESSNENVATVAADGTVTLVDLGTTTITVTAPAVAGK